MAIAGLLKGGSKLLLGASKSAGKAKTGANVASKMLNKKNVKSGAIVKTQPNKPTGVSAEGEKGGALVKSNASIVPRSVISTKSTETKESVGTKDDPIIKIKVKVIEIDKLLKGSVVEEKKRVDAEKKQKEKESRTGEEEELESKGKGKKKTKSKSKLKLPQLSFFDAIKKYILSIILASLVDPFIDLLPKLTQFLTVIVGVGDFIIDIGGKLLNGLITLVDWGYKVYDSARGFIGDKLGDNAQKNFDSLMENVNTMLNLALIAAMGALAFRPSKPKTPKGEKPKGVKPKKGQIVDSLSGKVRKKTKFEVQLQKKYKLSDQQIEVFRKAKQGGANTSQALTQARKFKPKPKPAKPQGFFGKLLEGTKDLAKKVGTGLNKISGGNLGKLGNTLQNQYNNASSFVRNKYDKIASVGDKIKNKFAEGANKLKSAASNVAEAAKRKIVESILKPLEPIFKPLLNKMKSIGENIMKQLSKIPGFDNVTKVLQKNGIKGLGDAKGLLKKIGPKAIPILGGLVNLLFAYDRLAEGDIIGGLLEATSGILDVSGAFGFAPGPGISLGMDAYLFARDFIPQIQEGEEKIVNGLGLGGIKGQLSELAAKLPNLSEIADGLMGKNENKKAWWDPMGVFTGKSEKSGLPSKSDEPNQYRTNRYLRDSGTGESATGATGKGMVTGPAGRIGAGAAYHVDTKFHKSIGMSGIISSMDKLSQSYANKGRVIEMSGKLVAGKKYNHNADMDQKKSLMQGAIDSHSHSKFMRAEGFLPFDYYIPKANDPKGRFGKSAEGAEILLPNFGGKINVGKLYGGYGKSADIYDTSGKWVAMTGHGDTAYELGGFTKAMAHRAVLGEKGREFVIDADSTKSIEETFPGFLNAINKADGDAAIDVLRNYAEYEMSEIIPIPIEVPVLIPIGGNRDQNQDSSVSLSGSTSSSEDPGDILYMR